MIGRVVSTKMEKTAVVLVERKKKHPLYQKSYLQTKKYLVDDSFGVKDGDVVLIEKIKPISKRKHWGIVKVLGADFVSLQEAVLKEGAAEAIAQVLPEESDESEQSAELEKSENLEAAVEVPVEEKPKKRATKKQKAEEIVEKPTVRVRAKKGAK